MSGVRPEVIAANRRGPDIPIVELPFRLATWRDLRQGFGLRAYWIRHPPRETDEEEEVSIKRIPVVDGASRQR